MFLSTYLPAQLRAHVLELRDFPVQLVLLLPEASRPAPEITSHVSMWKWKVESALVVVDMSHGNKHKISTISQDLRASPHTEEIWY